MYSKLATKNRKTGQILKQHHHIGLNKDFALDCKVWQIFLRNVTNVNLCRPFIDSLEQNSYQLTSFHSDASKKTTFGMGAVHDDDWVFGLWPKNFIQQCDPSIEFLEMFALCAGILTWQKDLANRRIIIYCDNMGVVNMINNNASKCRRCMYLLRILTLNGLIHNRRISVKYVSSKNNFLSDALSRLDFKQFQRLGPEMDDNPCETTVDLLPVSRILQLADNSI